jgi:hypothetical protein
VAELLDAVPGRDAAAGEHEAELGPLAPEEGERLQQPRVVLVRPGLRRVEEKRVARL